MHLVQIWWSYPEWVSNYRADKQVIDTQTQTDAGNDNNLGLKLASGKLYM